MPVKTNFQRSNDPCKDMETMDDLPIGVPILFVPGCDFRAVMILDCLQDEIIEQKAVLILDNLELYDFEYLVNDRVDFALQNVEVIDIEIEIKIKS